MTMPVLPISELYTMFPLTVAHSHLLRMLAPVSRASGAAGTARL